MHVLFVSNYFPPEVNAPATRLHEHARQWVKDGGNLDIITAVPNFPEGVVYPGYKNHYSQEEVEGIRVIRVPMYIAENKGTLKRSLSYVSFMISAIWYSRKIGRTADIVVASSPQFFCALAGYVISWMRGVPFVLEIRDLWPESIVAVGAMRRNLIIRLFERLERFLYRKASHIVVVTDSFKRIITEKGIEPGKITVLKNGADLESFSDPLDGRVLAEIRERYQLTEKFVAAYIGTIGMAHGAEILLEAARRCADPSIVFIVIGAGSKRESIAARQAQLGLTNFRLIEKQPKKMVRYFLEVSDVCVVHLIDVPLFATVLPSKIFEAMATRTPIALGIRGEALEILEESGGGIPFVPEDANALLDTVMQLRGDRRLYEDMASNGFSYVRRYHDRRKIAQSYWTLLQEIAAGRSATANNLMPGGVTEPTGRLEPEPIQEKKRF
jgi:glycosyltransferase involved in cell wall biosynthesis